MGIDEDLTMEEKKMRWNQFPLVEKARVERGKERRIEIDNRKIWLEEKEWRWDKKGRNERK